MTWAERRRYWLKIFRLFAVALLFVLLVVPFALGGMMMWGITHPPCWHKGDNPAQYGLSYEEITFTTAQRVTLRGFFMPGTNGATVMIVPTLNNDRSVDLPDAEVLNRAGFNVLTFESPPCTGRSVSLGYVEADDAEAAFAYLKSRADVDPARISIHGFSSAGATSLFTAARIPELRGVSAMGNYHDFAEQLGLRQNGNVIETLIRAGAALGYRLSTSMDVSVLSPLTAVDAITPRPILLIYGSREVSLPGARAMLERANANGGHAELYIVEGAGHGHYLEIAGDEYTQRLVEFHQRVLAVDVNG